MADATVTSPAPRKKRRWLRALAWIFSFFVLMVVVGYFVATSSGFFKSVILPKVSAALNAKVTVSEASISPFSEVVLKDLKVETTGTEPLVTASEVHLRYSLRDMIGGNIHVDEATLTSPTVTLVENPDGTSNLDPILKAQQAKPKSPEPAKPSKPLQIDIRKVAMTEGTVRQIKSYKQGNRDVTELAHVNVSVENLKNSQSGKLTLAADIGLQNNPPAPGASGVLQAKLTGNFNLALSPDLKPASIQGNTRLNVARAEGALAQVAALNANLDCDITPTDIKQVALRFQRGETRLGEMIVNGPFDMEKTEGRLTVRIINIDKNLLNLAGASSGVDFGPTTINSTNEIGLAKAGAEITTAGSLILNQFQLTRTNQTTPPLDLRADYNLSVDRGASNAVVRVFTLTANQKGNQVIRGDLTSPMTISWGNAANAVGDSTLNFTVAHLQLADWKPFVGDVAPVGDINAKLQLVSQQAGKQLKFEASSEINNLTAGSGSNQITQANVTLSIRGSAADLKQFDFPEFKLQVARQNQPLVVGSGSAKYDMTAQTADAQVNAQVMLARLLQTFPQPDLNISAGTAEVKLHVTQKPMSPVTNPKSPAVSQDVTGSFALADFTGQVGKNSFHSFGTTADIDIGMTPQQVQIRKCAGQLSDSNKPGGGFDLTGTYDLTNKSANLTAKLKDFNQNGLRPFLEAMLTDKKLVSVAVNANAVVQYEPQGASSVKGDLQLTNLVVNDPKGQIPATPLGAYMQWDASLNKNVAEIRQFQLGLTPTARATNQVQLAGRVDMSNTNALQGNLKLTADSLDMTTYYDLFSGQKKATEMAATPPAAPQPSSGSAPSGPQKEPDPIRIPATNFVVEATIGRFYLHEVDISSFQVKTAINGGSVNVNPFKLVVNGAPISSTVDLDLGVPGFKYNVSFNAQKVPIAPLVDSFQPDNKGILSGTFTAQASIKGAGITGSSLQTNLAGQFDASSTNLNLSVDKISTKSKYTRLLRTVINGIIILPDLARNPASTLTSLLSPSSSSGSGTNEMHKSLIDAIALKGTIGDGKVNLEKANVESRTFIADASSGMVTLDKVLTNSPIQIPVKVYLEHMVAQRINLVPAGTPADAKYVKLPDYLVERGTIGDPKQDINKTALLGTALQGLSGLAGKNSGLLQGLGNALTGNTVSDTNAPAGTNQQGSGLGGLLNNLGGARRGKSGANTNAPPDTNQAPLNSLLNDFLHPKKK